MLPVNDTADIIRASPDTKTSSKWTPEMYSDEHYHSEWKEVLTQEITYMAERRVYTDSSLPTSCSPFSGWRVNILGEAWPQTVLHARPRIATTDAYMAYNQLRFKVSYDGGKVNDGGKVRVLCRLKDLESTGNIWCVSKSWSSPICSCTPAALGRREVETLGSRS